MASFDWLSPLISKDAPRSGRRIKIRSAVSRLEHLEDRRLLSVTPAILSSNHPSTPSNVLVVTNTLDYNSTQTPIPGSLRYELAIADTLSSATIDFNLGTSSSKYGPSSSSTPVIVLTGGPL